MDRKTAFRVGFLTKCAAAGLTLDQSLKYATGLRRLVKRAAAPPAAAVAKASPILAGLKSLLSGIGSVGSGAVSGAGEAAGKVAPWVIGAGLAAPPAIGYLGGRALADATDYDDTDVDEIRQREIADEYRRNAVRLRLSERA